MRDRKEKKKKHPYHNIFALLHGVYVHICVNKRDVCESLKGTENTNEQLDTGKKKMSKQVYTAYKVCVITFQVSYKNIHLHNIPKKEKCVQVPCIFTPKIFLGES